MVGGEIITIIEDEDGDINGGETSNPGEGDLHNNGMGPGDSVEDAVKKTVTYCLQHEDINPVEVLRCLQAKMVYGRALDVQNPSEVHNGDTNFILVDRDNLLQTAFDEITNISDLRKTLEVQFYNESAEDYGGPRKEFFRIVLKEIKETYFDRGLREMLCDNYLIVGIIMGLSMLQNEKMPNFIEEEIIQKIFSKEIEIPCVMQIREGLSKVGIYEVGCQLPVMLHLFRPGPSQPITFRKLISLLKPNFSAIGSNARKYICPIHKIPQGSSK